VKLPASTTCGGRTGIRLVAAGVWYNAVASRTATVDPSVPDCGARPMRGALLSVKDLFAAVVSSLSLVGLVSTQRACSLGRLGISQ
jgi:hypothetical protein